MTITWISWFSWFVMLDVQLQATCAPSMQTNIEQILKDLDVLHWLIHHCPVHIVSNVPTHTSICVSRVNEIVLSEKFKILQPYLGDMGNEHGEPTTSYIRTSLCSQITSSKPLGNQPKHILGQNYILPSRNKINNQSISTNSQFIIKK